jgi:hypothetical protein
MSAVRRYRRSDGDSVTRIDVHDARPGSPCLPAVHRVGAPELLTEAIEEIGMVQVHTCVSVHCDQCGDALGDPGLEAHYPTEDAALDAAAARGWQVSPSGRLWCSACGSVLACAADDHEFTEWCPIDKCQELFTPLGQASSADDRHSVSYEYRYCRRCCLHESRPAAVLVGGEPR